MEDCHVGADTFVLPTAAVMAVPDTRAFYAVNTPLDMKQGFDAQCPRALRT